MDPATGTPIHGKLPKSGQATTSEPGAPVARLLDPADLDDTFERQESRLPELDEKSEQSANIPKGQ